MGSKKILLVMGSPRKEGNSATLAKQVAAGAQATGAKIETFYLHTMNIQPCTACDACREERDKDCVIDGDMETLYPKLRQADALVIASPIYVFAVCAQTKLFMDRWYALGGPGEEYAAFAGKRIGIVLTYADADPFVSRSHGQLRPALEIKRLILSIHESGHVPVDHAECPLHRDNVDNRNEICSTETIVSGILHLQRSRAVAELPISAEG